MHNDDKTCGNCCYYGWMFEAVVTVPDRNAEHGLASRKLAPCLWNNGAGYGAVEPDAGFGAVVLLGPESHCRCHADAWQPSEDFRRELAEENDYGVRPGVDFPATLQRQRHAF